MLSSMDQQTYSFGQLLPTLYSRYKVRNIIWKVKSPPTNDSMDTLGMGSLGSSYKMKVDQISIVHSQE